MKDWIHKILIPSTPQLRGACERSWAVGYIWGVLAASMVWLAVLWVVVGVLGGAA